MEHTHAETEEPRVINGFTINSFFDNALVFNLSASTFSSSKYIPLSSNSKHFKFNGSQRKDILVSPGLKHGVGAVLYLQQVVRVKATQLCLSLCDPMDYTVHGILQARILEWVAFSFSRGFPWKFSWSRIGLQCRRPGFDPWVGKTPWRREKGVGFFQMLFLC